MPKLTYEKRKRSPPEAAPDLESIYFGFGGPENLVIGTIFNLKEILP